MKLNIRKRDVFGKKLKKHRENMEIPGIVYGKHVEGSIPVFFGKNEFLKVYKDAGESTPINIQGDKIKEMVLIHDIHVDPVSDRLKHVDFHAVSRDEKTEAEIPVHLTGESPVEKQSLGKIELIKGHILVEAYPQDLPHDITLDISNIESDSDVVFVKDLNISDKAKIKEDFEQPVITVSEIKEEPEEEETTEEEAGEGE